ncbi:MAG TPA: terpene cyclase/mutase family protein [Actinocrinis sp.]|nr:terpene cyclase/mutase family protein [Actinocrinis sp.]
MTAIADRPLPTGATSDLPSDLRDHASLTAARARDRLLAMQDPAGWWKGELATNVTMDAEDLLVREYLGIRTVEETAEAARWIRSQQRADGTWATFQGGPSDLSTTVEAYLALRLAGDLPQEPHMARAAAWVREHGGLERTRVFTRIWLAVCGLWSWDRLPVMPPELIFLPSKVPLNVYDWACWARQTVVPLTVVSHFRPSRPLPFGIDELRVDGPEDPRTPLGSWPSVAGMFTQVDRVLHKYERLRRKPGRKAALRQAVEWIVARQEADGGWGGIQPPWVYSLIALNLMGFPLDHPVMRAGLAGLEGFLVREETPTGPIRRLEACQSPVWDTALAVIALADAGLPGDDPAMERAVDWLVGEEITVPGDWQVRRPGLAPGGWAFEFANDLYPDTDDTAEVLLALRRSPLHRLARSAGADQDDGPVPDYGEPNGRPADSAAGLDLEAARRRGVDWMIGMQCVDGGWGAFDADNTRALIEKLPFCDFGAVIDPPSADVTAHIVEALALEGHARHPATLRGVRWLLEHQESGGSWFGRWGANHVYGTGAVVPALLAAGVAPGHPAVRRAVAWLLKVQNADGGWGEDLRSYTDPAWIGRGQSTASQTAWALLALLAQYDARQGGRLEDLIGWSLDLDASLDARLGGELDGAAVGGAGGLSNVTVIDGVEPSIAPEADPVWAAVERGIGFLVDTQRPDGNWDEELFTGTGFPGDFYINYHLYRLVFPLTALGRYVRARRPSGRSGATHQLEVSVRWSNS